MILAGDIGGTHTRLALFDRSGPFIVHDEQKYRSREYSSLSEIVLKFLEQKKIRPESACFGVAGAVRNGVCQATNLPWMIDEKQLKNELSIPSIRIINDLESNAYGISAVSPDDLYEIHPGQKQEGNRAIIAAGTGLGEAGMYWDGKKYYPFACEGGHGDFAPRNEEEIDLFLYMKRRFHHVSYERVVSGPGIYAIYQFLVETGREPISKEVEERMKQEDPSRVICEFGKLRRDSASVRTVDLFLSLYGAEAGNLALKFLALGGLYIGGGIAPNLKEEIKRSGFHASFVDKGRFNHLLDSIPIYLILNDSAALLGAAVYGRGL